MRTLRFAAAAAAVLMLSACKGREAPPTDDAPPPPPRPALLTGVPAVGASLLTDTTGTPEADRKTYLVQLPIDSVQRFYRTRLPAEGWHVISDQGDTAKMDLYTRNDSLSLWVHAERLGVLATSYTLIASRTTRRDTVPDSTAH